MEHHPTVRSFQVGERKRGDCVPTSSGRPPRGCRLFLSSVLGQRQQLLGPHLSPRSSLEVMKAVIGAEGTRSCLWLWHRPRKGSAGWDSLSSQLPAAPAEIAQETWDVADTYPEALAAKPQFVFHLRGDEERPGATLCHGHHCVGVLCSQAATCSAGTILHCRALRSPTATRHIGQKPFPETCRVPTSSPSRNAAPR